MKIELRRVIYSAALSRETSLFQAEVWIDGKRAGTAENRGAGGATLIDPHELEQRLSDHAKTLPPIIFGDRELAQSAETIIDAALERHLVREAVKKRLAAKIVFVKDGSLHALSAIAKVRKAHLADLDGFKRTFQTDVVLNALPIDDAVQIWTNIERAKTAPA